MSEKGESFKTLLVAYDDTPASKRALERAADLAELFGGELFVVSVAPIVYGIRGGPFDTVDSKERHQEHLNSARAFLASRKLEAGFIEGVGDPGDTIVDVAEHKGAKLIVIGSRALSSLERALGQSVSGYVQRNTRCDVLCVH